jgi:hypothetical protein
VCSFARSDWRLCLRLVNMAVVGAAADRMVAGAGSAVVADRMEDLAAEEVRRRLLAADLMQPVEVLRATVVAAAAADIGGIRSTADLQLPQRLLKAACLPETSSRSRAQLALQNILRLGTILGWSRRAHRRAPRHASIITDLRM